MKRIIRIAILLSILFIIASVNATDIYNIHDVRNIETSIHMQDKPVNAYIDYRDVNEAQSGGYIEESKEFILPHDLGLGKHMLEIETENGMRRYDFYVVKGDEDTSLYEGYTPYYYEDDPTDEMIDDDFTAFIGSMMEDEKQFAMNEKKIIATTQLIPISVRLGISTETDDSLTSKEIGLTL